MLDEQLAARAVEAFVSATAGEWGRPRPELQDGGTFILLSVEVPVSHAGSLSPPGRAAVAEALNRVVPPNSEQPPGAWMVVFVRNGEVYDSLFRDGV